ncbi:cinnamoyl-CoA reductase [Aureobasidium pullulans]|nr:cinnamoyl-CoA reductase [Aureobasidium pullulans]
MHLLKEGSFAQAMQGCDIVHHVASPFLVPQQIKDGMKDIVEPAIKGTQNVLNTANQTESVKRIVLTSSIAAMYGDSADILHHDNATLTESHWNTTSTATSSAYSYSKVAAEREAWKICHAQSRWDLIAINPGLVIGPSLTPESASGSLHMLEAMYKGDNKMGAPELRYPIADVREVAEAHVRAGVDAAAKGRYIVASERSVSQLEMANLVRPYHKKPDVLPKKNLPKFMIYLAGPFMGVSMKWVSRNIGIGYKVDNRRSVEELGIVYRSKAETMRDHYNAWVEAGGK